MIRLALLIAILGIAMLVGPILANNPGYVMLVFGGITLEATLIGLLFVLALLSLTLWLVWQLCKRLFHLPRLSFGFLRSRQDRRARQALQQGMLAFVRQDWQSADRYFDLAKAEPEWMKMKQIMACYSALHHGDVNKANQLAAALDQTDPDNWLVVADLYIQQQTPERAVSFLADKMPTQLKNCALGRVWLQALLLAKQWQQALQAVPSAIKYQWFSKAEWQQYRFKLYPYAISQLTAQAQFDERAAYWTDLPSKERKSLAVSLGKVWAQAEAGHVEQAQTDLLKQLTLADLAVAWPVIRHIPLGRSVVQLRKQLQQWLHDHHNNAYLYALLSYCAEQEGDQAAAEQSWQKALQYQPDLVQQR